MIAQKPQTSFSLLKKSMFYIALFAIENGIIKELTFQSICMIERSIDEDGVVTRVLFLHTILRRVSQLVQKPASLHFITLKVLAYCGPTVVKI